MIFSRFISVANCQNEGVRYTFFYDEEYGCRWFPPVRLFFTDYWRLPTCIQRLLSACIIPSSYCMMMILFLRSASSVHTTMVAVRTAILSNCLTMAPSCIVMVSAALFAIVTRLAMDAVPVRCVSRASAGPVCHGGNHGGKVIVCWHFYKKVKISGRG